ncbi:MAG TPA: cation-transporting P-type ATPase, partial [Candidatus Nitrosotenuis sp.]|nr:cation-transporting P-type ATPase [Candidatus Nitrosotenuis sp.]
MNAEPTVKDLFTQFHTSENGLTADVARENLIQYGSNILKPKKKTDLLTLFLTQFKSPIILILISASVLSLILKNSIDAAVILA